MNVASNQDDANAAKQTRFACDFCGRTYAWNREFLGQAVTCTCGRELVVPEIGDINVDDLYDIKPDDRPKRVARPPVSPAPFKAGEGAVVAQATRVEPIQYQHPKTPGATELDRLFPDRVKDLWLPIGLIGGGFVVEVVHTFVTARFWRYGMRGAMVQLGTNVILLSGIMLVAIFIAAKIRKIEFGPPLAAVLKLCAVVMGALGLTHFIGSIVLFIPLFGGLFYAVIAFVSYFTLMGALFDLDQSDTWYCTLIMFLVWLGMYFALRALA
jgi:hypothetical protein